MIWNNMKRVIVHICVIFTFMTALEFPAYEKVLNANLAYRLGIITIIVVISEYLFRWLDRLPYRVTQLIHFIASFGLCLAFTKGLDTYTSFTVSGDGYRHFIISYVLGYIIISIVYEVKYKLDVKIHDALLKRHRALKKPT